MLEMTGGQTLYGGRCLRLVTCVDRPARRHFAPQSIALTNASTSWTTKPILSRTRL